jgi:general secretion pathway protein N
MKTVLRYSLWGMGFYLLFLAVLFPAVQAYRFAAEPLKAALPQLEPAGLDGSVWSGSVKSLIYRKAVLGELNWQLSPLPLLLGEVQLQALLQSREGYLQSQVNTPIGGGAVELYDIEGRMPINELTRFAPYMPIALDGGVSFDLPRVVLNADGRVQQADGTLIWHQAAMSAPQALSFGELQLVLRTEDKGKISGDISDRGGPLKVQGKLSLAPDGGYRVNATVSAAKDAPDNLRQSLGWLGKPDAQGRYLLNYSGKI